MHAITPVEVYLAEHIMYIQNETSTLAMHEGLIEHA